VTAALVEYLVARDGAPHRKGLAFDYLLAGDGVYLVADNEHLAVRVPIANCEIRGLPLVYPSCNLKHGRIPGWIWDAIVWAAHVGYMSGHEVLLTVRFDPSVGYRLTVPHQVAGPAHVVYRPTADAILEIHSHGPHAAAFSPTDDADEQGLRLYGVVGRLGTERPEVALRVGAYGHFLAVPWETAFQGDLGAFQDTAFALPLRERQVDAVPR
jgi:PRTRC genetic system protein A